MLFTILATCFLSNDFVHQLINALLRVYSFEFPQVLEIIKLLFFLRFIEHSVHAKIEY